MARIVRFITICFICLAIVPRVGVAQSVIADISSKEAVVDETLTVQVQVVNPTTASAPQPPQTPDFDIQMDSNPPLMSSSMQQDFSGVVTSRVTYTYRFYVRPRREGVLILPAFERKEGDQVYRSAPIRVRVGRPEQTEDVLCLVKSNYATAYVGQSVDLTMEIWIRKFHQRDIGTLQPESLWGLKDLRASSFGVFSTADLNRPGLRQSQRRDLDGNVQDYYVYILETTTFPSEPGKIDFSDIRITINYPVELGQTMLSLRMIRKRTITAQAKGEPVEIKPLPSDGRPPDFSGAIGDYRITATAKPTDVPVGDPITLTYSIHGDGPLERLRPPRLDRVKSLTADFEISGESLGGEVESGRKVFTQTIRALREDVTRIPPIPFSYFDPTAGKYQVAYSSAIPLKVRPTQRVVLSDGSPLPFSQQSVLAPLSESTEGLFPNVSDPRLVLADQAASIGLGTMAIVILLPSIYVVAWFVQRRSFRLRNNVGLRRSSRALATAVRNLRAADSPGRVRSALIGYVADRCNVPAGGLTRAEVSALLGGRGAAPELVSRVDQLLDTLEQAEYGGGQLAVTPQLIEQTQAALSELERHVTR
jgi:hypothetical protein